MALYKKLNYATGTLASGIADDAVEVVLNAGHSITTDTGIDNNFIGVFFSGSESSPYQDANREIVDAYRTDTNTFTITRAQESTSAKAWSQGDNFMLIASAGVFDEYETELGLKAPLTAPTFTTSITGSYLTASEILITDANKNIVSASVATYPSLIELSYVKGLSSDIQSQLNAKGVGDMLLSGVQSVTGLKTFDKDKIAMKGTSTGVNTISVANTSATSYTNTLPAKNGTFAMTDDIVSQVEDNITDGHTTVAPSGNAVFDALALKANLISPSFTTPTLGAATGTSLDLEGTTLKMLSLKNTDANSYTRMLFDGTGVDFAQGVGNASATITDLRDKFYIYDFTNSKTAFTIVPNTLAAKLYGSLEVVGGLTGTLTLPKTTKIQDTSADHTYNLAVSELTADRTVTLPLLTGDDTFLFKDFHKATSTEINTGTEDNKYVTPDALAGSNAFTKTVQQICVEFATDLAVADGVGYIVIPAECNGMNLISARADVITAGTTNASTFDIYNVTDSTTMLSSAISIDSGAKSGTGTVDTAHDDVATGDIIRVDIDSVSTTAPSGLIITLAFRLP